MRAGRPSWKELPAEERARHAARSAARHAENTGKLRRVPCQWGERPGEREGVAPDRRTCGVVEVERHHDDYDKPLEVRYLCKPHHVLADRARKPTQRTLLEGV
jgi:hypothetical protein